MEPAGWSPHEAVFQLNSQIPSHSNSSRRATRWRPWGGARRRRRAPRPRRGRAEGGVGRGRSAGGPPPSLRGSLPLPLLRRLPPHGRAQGPGLWSHRIFQRYAASLPTSLSCILSVDQRRSAEETSCGDSVRQREEPGREPRRGVPWGWWPARCAYKAKEGAAPCAPPTRPEGRQRRASCKGGGGAPSPATGGGRRSHVDRSLPRHAGFVYRHRGGAALPSRGPCLHLACRSMARVLPASEGKDNSPERTPAHAPRCMLTRGVATIEIQRSRSGVTERCMRLLVRQSRQQRPGTAEGSPLDGPAALAALVTRCALPLGLQSTDPRSTAVGAEPCSTPVLNQAAAGATHYAPR